MLCVSFFAFSDQDELWGIRFCLFREDPWVGAKQCYLSLPLCYTNSSSNLYFFSLRLYLVVVFAQLFEPVRGREGKEKGCVVIRTPIAMQCFSQSVSLQWTNTNSVIVLHFTLMHMFSSLKWYLFLKSFPSLYQSNQDSATLPDLPCRWLPINSNQYQPKTLRWTSRCQVLQSWMDRKVAECCHGRYRRIPAGSSVHPARNLPGETKSAKNGVWINSALDDIVWLKIGFDLPTHRESRNYYWPRSASPSKAWRSPPK